MSEVDIGGRLALVTGASSGLGVDFARQLAQRGCDLILVARREDRLQAVQAEISGQFGVDVATVALDLTAEEARRQLHDRIKAGGRTVDVLINNAGFGIHGLSWEIPWEREKQMLEIDIVALSHLTKLFLPDMLAQNFGIVLLIASIGAYQPSPTYASYSAAKAFVLSYGEAVAYELRNTDVSVTVLSPGVAATEFLEVAGQKPTLYQRIAMMQSADVARIGIEAMLRRKPSQLAGRLNALTGFSMRFIPRRWQAALAHRAMMMR